MNKIRISEPENNITINDILDFQAALNIEIPSNLRQLLLKYNGGVATNSDIISQFFSIKYGQLLMNEVINDIQVVEENIPKQYLPFAITGVGHFIAMKVEGSNRGRIYLFRHDDFEPVSIANSLEEILGVQTIDDL